MVKRLEEIVDEISTLVVMLDEQSFADSAGEVLQALSGLQQACSREPAYARLAAACAEFRSKQRTAKEFVPLVNALLSQAQIFLRNPQAAVFPNEKPVEACAETNGNVDPQFLVEFIEKHLSMMEDFESAIMDLKYQLNNGDVAPGQWEDIKREFEAYVKGYVHNVKGDAGSIGLTGIEKTCHFVEDILSERSAAVLMEQLLTFKEWAVVSMKAFSQDQLPPEGSDCFRKRFAEACAAAVTDEQPRVSGQKGAAAETASVPAREAAGQKDVAAVLGEDLPPEANLDLLAELLGEGVKTNSESAAPAPAAESHKEPQSAEAPGAEQPTYMVTGDLEVFAEFCVEAEDHLNSIESILLEASGEYSKDAVDSIFRGIHSIKGASSYFGLKETTETSHLTETVLGEVRDGKRELDQHLAEIVLTYVDLQQNLLRTAKEAVKSNAPVVKGTGSENYLKRLRAFQEGRLEEQQAPRAMIYASKETPSSPVSTPVPESKAPAKREEVEQQSAQGKGEKLEVKNFVKVDTQRLDLLIDSIGEMCIYSSMLIQHCRDYLADNAKVLQTTHQVEKLSRDLQHIGMSMRLIPIRGLFQKMSRLVWDTAKKIGKDVKFQMHGEETELDRTIIDKLADPLMHMVRNALDHGIEPPDERENNGKPRAGSISLSAFHAAGSIHIKIEDDGRGLDTGRLLRKAIEKGLVAEGQSLSKSEIYSLIFAPGFSTAAVVTDISGRGVGMDVVKRNIESMRGRVQIHSEVGKGSVFTIELPLTLAIIDGIQVAVGKEGFIIPTLSVIEFMKPDPNLILRALDKGETYRFRGKFLPVYRLSDLFGVETEIQKAEDGVLVIVETVGEQVALLVDEILGTYSTVIKNLGDMFEQGKGVAGCAIMANGDVALILDIRSLLNTARAHYVFQGASGSELAEKIMG